MTVGWTLKELMHREGWSQSEVARRAGVSQPTVSRMLSGAGGGSGAAYRKLYSFIQKQAQLGRAPEEAVDALRQIWDGSDNHAASLAELIRASGGLWPGLSKQREQNNR